MKTLWRTRRTVMAVAGLLALATPALAQTGSISGRVTDQASGNGVVAARVQIVGTSLIGTTLSDGRYTIVNIPAGSYEIRVVAVGYAALKQNVAITAGQRATLDFALTVVPFTLEEIVITATGEQRKLELGNAMTSIKTDSIVQYSAVTNLGNLLQGKSAGVAILPSSGTTGTGTRIRIRGANSLNLSNEPLIVIDGAYTNRGTNSLSITTGGQAPSRLNDLNPEEIQSIEIVKGPAAATLYGGDAANGVIVVTTKKGKAGKAQWQGWLEQGMVKDPNQYPDNYKSYGRNVTNGVPTGAAVTCLLESIGRGLCVQDSLTTLNPLMNKYLTPIGTGNRAQYGLSVQGGSELVRYFVSGEYEDENGTFKLPKYEENRLLANRGELDPWVMRPNALSKTSLRTNINASPSAKVDVGVSVGYVTSEVRLPQNDNNVLGMLPSGYFGKASAADTTTPSSCGSACGNNNGWGFYKPGEIFSLLREQGIERFTSSLQGNARPTSWLALRATVGYDINNRTDYSFNPTGLGPPFSTDYTQGRLDDNRFQQKSLTVDLGANANARISNSIASRTSVGFQWVDDHLLEARAAGRGIPAGARTVTGAATQFASTQNLRTKSVGLWAEEQLTFKDRLFVTGGLRADDASSIGKEYNITLFPKLSVSYLISEEGFFPRGSFINLLRLRGAYGQSGLYPGVNDALIYLAPTTAAVAGSSSSAVTVGGFGLSTLQPEHATEYEVGIDAGLWQDRVSIEATYYNKTSKNALINRVLPPSNGIVASRFENLGRVRNQGLELGIYAQLLRGGSTTWDMSLTGSLLKNELLELGKDENGQWIPPVVADPQRHVPGYPLGGFWTRGYTWADTTKDGLIDRREVTMQALTDTVVMSPDGTKAWVVGAKYIGPSLPTREASLNTTLGLFRDRVRLAARMDYVGGNYQYNNTEGFRCIGTGNNCYGIMSKKAPLDQQARAVVRRFVDGASQQGYIENSSFAKLREVSVTYTVPDNWARSLKMTRLSLTAAGRNLATITNYTGVDPEVNGQGQAVFGGFGVSDFLTQPQVRTFVLRLNVGF